MEEFVDFFKPCRAVNHIRQNELILDVAVKACRMVQFTVNGLHRGFRGDVHSMKLIGTRIGLVKVIDRVGIMRRRGMTLSI